MVAFLKRNTNTRLVITLLLTYKLAPLLVLVVVIYRLGPRQAQIIDERKLLSLKRLRHENLQRVQPLILRTSKRHLLVRVFVFIELQIELPNWRLCTAFDVTKIDVGRVGEELKERRRPEVVRIYVVAGGGLAVATGVFYIVVEVRKIVVSG